VYSFLYNNKKKRHEFISKPNKLKIQIRDKKKTTIGYIKKIETKIVCIIKNRTIKIITKQISKQLP
jgi:hypothetical protein